ncbi:acyl-homoserine-lactone synthase [Phaeobacter sp. HF9A]|uniref:acyl-homoserine-lactone synthase n=1 Tax=Phaeobacter sp. HF9A TaxID=2721561 RepID=UPI00142FD4E6|nr:hypothetical protein [Phaeobacter sp. HF9A]
MNLSDTGGCEFDEYDTPASVHVVALSADQVVGCLHLLRTDNVQGQLTYMILDAHRGRIPNLPTGLLKQEIRSPECWEASRLAISPNIPSQDRNNVLVALMDQARRYARAQGGQSLLGLMSPLFVRVFLRAGMNAYRIGPVVDQRDGRICVLKMDF